MSFSDWVVVFDLDDTLYPELDYVRSGITAVEEYISNLYALSFGGRIHAAFDNGISDLWGWSCEELGLPMEVKVSFLWIYRLHKPNIKLDLGAKFLIDKLSSSGVQLAILSDGRSVSQRLKVVSLGLHHLPMFVSEEFSSNKPNTRRFVEIEQKWPILKYAYIGDNEEKDFIAPNSLGWLTIGARWIIPRVHPSVKFPSENSLPAHWADDPSQIFNLISWQ